MRIAYLDCFAGISGDMFLGALLDAGVPAHTLHDAATALNLNAKLKIETVDRSGISCTRVHVFADDVLAEATLHPHPHTAGQPTRSLSTIRSLIQSAPLADPIKQTAIRTFELLGHTEARIHNIPIEDIHFHEVGAVDSIVDVVAASAGIHHLQIDAWFCSALNVGGGTVLCAHGTFPVPAPATADLLRGTPTYSANIQKELVTPTGAALIRALNPTFGPQPAMTVTHLGYGAGSRNPKDFPNALRLSIGQTAAINNDTVTVLETAIDDLSPQILAHVAEAALAQGALDVMLTPVIMKKGRPGTLLTILCNAPQRAALETLIFTETTTLGIRIREDRRTILNRHYVTVSTPFGDIRIKVGSHNNETLNIAPEFEDCRAAAQQRNVPLKRVQQAALAAYTAGSL